MPRTILIVDDAPDWRDMLAGLIQEVFPEIEVITASSLDEAKTELTRNDFQLAIIDIRLDDSDEANIDGLVLADFMRKQYPQTQALIITGYADLETVKRAMQPDMNGLRMAADYVEKDKLSSELLPRISAVLGTR
jgi:two-component system response regulator HydG